MPFLAVASFALAVAISAAAPAMEAAGDGLPPGAVIARGQGVIYFRAPITRETSRRLIELIEEDPLPLVVTSSGGDEGAGLDIGEAIQKFSLPVRVERFCLSGCVNIILVAANGRTIAPGTLLGIHGSAPASRLRYQRNRLKTPADIENYAHRYETLYAKARADVDLLLCGAVMSGMTDRPLKTADGLGGWWMVYNFWVPDLATLQRFGIAVERGDEAPKTARARADFVQRTGLKPSIRLNWNAAPRKCP